MRFQDAALDGRAIVYQGIQRDPLVARVASLLVEASAAERWMARAAMNGERTDPDAWRRIFPSLFGERAGADLRDRAERLLALSLQVADRGEQSRSQYRGAIVEELTERLLARRAGLPGDQIRRERRVLFDGVRAEIHPYDVTVESAARPAVYDCKWGARAIGADVLDQLDDARRHARDEEIDLGTAVVVFDAGKTCRLRLERMTSPHDETALVAIESLDTLSRGPDRADRTSGR